MMPIAGWMIAIVGIVMWFFGAAETESIQKAITMVAGGQIAIIIGVIVFTGGMIRNAILNVKVDGSPLKEEKQ